MHAQMKAAMATWAKDPSALNKAAAVAVMKEHHPRCNRATPVGKKPPSASSIFSALKRSHDGEAKEDDAQCNPKSNAKNTAKNKARLQKSLLANTDEGEAMSMDRTLAKAGSVFACMIEQIPAGHSLASLRLLCVGASNASHVRERTLTHRQDWECTGATGTRHGRILPCHSHDRQEVLQMEEALIDLLVESVGWDELKNTNRQVCVRVC